MLCPRMMLPSFGRMVSAKAGRLRASTSRSATKGVLKLFFMFSPPGAWAVLRTRINERVHPRFSKIRLLWQAGEPLCCRDGCAVSIKRLLERPARDRSARRMLKRYGRLAPSQSRPSLLIHFFESYFFVCLSSDDSSGLFSCGLTVERMTMTLFRRSNQKGAPIEMAAAVNSQPIRGERK